jgi:hypothetical protein
MVGELLMMVFLGLFSRLAPLTLAISLIMWWSRRPVLSSRFLGLLAVVAVLTDIAFARPLGSSLWLLGSLMVIAWWVRRQWGARTEWWWIGLGGMAEIVFQLSLSVAFSWWRVGLQMLFLWLMIVIFSRVKSSKDIYVG